MDRYDGTHVGQRTSDMRSRAITHLRAPIADQCDLRRVYRMAENMTFLRNRDQPTLEEINHGCSVFNAKGVRRIWTTGSKPSVRRNRQDEM